MKNKEIIKIKLSQLEKQFSELAKDVVDLNKNVSELRQTIAKNVEVAVEEVKSELIVGEWYKWGYKGANLIFRITKIGRIYIHYYGIEDGEWVATIIHKDNVFKKATHQEVETALLNEAKKKYKVGDSAICSYNGDVQEIKHLNFSYMQERNSVVTNIGEEDSVSIFYNGIWAEIEETIKEDEIDWNVPQLVITNSGKVVATNGIHKGNNFSGNVVVFDNVTQPVNYFCSHWCKEYFKPFKGKLTIEQSL